jgi:hypothetical protein
MLARPCWRVLGRQIRELELVEPDPVGSLPFLAILAAVPTFGCLATSLPLFLTRPRNVSQKESSHAIEATYRVEC